MIIGCPYDLLDVLKANLHCLAQQNFRRLLEIVVVIENGRDRELNVVLLKQFPMLPIRVISLSPESNTFDLSRSLFAKPAWLKCWLKWVVGISSSRAEAVVLHDLDACILNSNFFEERYDLFKDSRQSFSGLAYYKANGLCENDQLITTFEMFFSGRTVRERFVPTDAFNRVVRLGRDWWNSTRFLWIQHVLGGSRMAPIDANDMVHPSQMICQYVEFIERGRLLSQTRHNLLILPILCVDWW